MPTCFSKDECDVIDSGNYIWRQPEKLSPDVPTFLLSIHPCFSLAFLLHRILVHGNRFSLSGSTFKSSQNHLHKRSPHFIPPHCWQSCVSTTHLSSLNQLKTYHHGGSTPSCQALHPKQDVPACWEYAAKKSTPITPDHATSSGQPRHTPVPN